MTDTTWSRPASDTSPIPPPIATPSTHTTWTTLHTDGYWAHCSCGWHSDVADPAEKNAALLAWHHRQTTAEASRMGTGLSSAYMPLLWGALAVAIAGIFLPWVTVVAPFIGQFNITGFDTDYGKLVLAAFGALGALLVAEQASPSATVRTVMGLVGLAILAAIGYEASVIVTRFADVNATGFGRADLGVGLFLNGAGVVGVLLFTALRHNAR